MMINLLSNAIKFTPNGGSINVEAKIIKKPDDLSIDDLNLIKVVVNNPNKSFLEIKVKDTGIGIS